MGNSFGSLISLVSATKLRPKGCPGFRKDGEDAGFGGLELSCALFRDVRVCQSQIVACGMDGKNRGS